MKSTVVVVSTTKNFCSLLRVFELKMSPLSLSPCWVVLLRLASLSLSLSPSLSLSFARAMVSLALSLSLSLCLLNMSAFAACEFQAS